MHRCLCLQLPFSMGLEAHCTRPPTKHSHPQRATTCLAALQGQPFVVLLFEQSRGDDGARCARWNGCLACSILCIYAPHQTSQFAGEKMVRMAYLGVIASHTVNGVAAIHSEIIRETVFKDFAELWPGKFTNVTNGVTQRRWLAFSNPALRQLLTKRLGSEAWIKCDQPLLFDMWPCLADAMQVADPLPPLHSSHAQDAASVCASFEVHMQHRRTVAHSIGM
jgi:hypothetical protein